MLQKERAMKQSKQTTKKTLKIKTNVKSGFTPQPEPPGIVDLGGPDLPDLPDPGSLFGGRGL